MPPSRIGLCLAALFAGGTAARAQCPDGTPPPCRARGMSAARAPATNSVAVLYFENLSRDSTDAYLADGLTEEVTDRLGAVERLQVKSRSLVRRYRDAGQTNLAAIGRDLRVRYLVEGSVRRGPDRVRVSVRLVRAEDGVRVWGANFDGTTRDVLSFQEQIAREVGSAIAGRLLPEEQRSLSTRPTTNPVSYDHFLRGNYLLARRTEAGTARAIEEYEAAARLDPGFVSALARVAYAYSLAYIWAWEIAGQPVDSVLARGARAAERALARDSGSSDAWMARASILSHLHPRSLEGVREAYQRAIRLDPRNAEAIHQFGSTLAITGDHAGSNEMLHRALALDADRPVSLVNLALLDQQRKDYVAALRWTDSALAMDPGWAHGYEHRAVIQALMGRRAEAEADVQTALRLSGAAGAAGGLVSALAGDTARALERIAQAIPATLARRRPAYEEGLWVIAALAASGRREEALAAIEAAWPRGARLWDLLSKPEFDGLRGEPRFQRVFEDSRPPGGEP